MSDFAALTAEDVRHETDLRTLFGVPIGTETNPEESGVS